jgi:hypothetical protein
MIIRSALQILNDILVFETVIVNEGEHYDPYDGVFVAPQKGVYLFSWTVSGDNANYILTELVVEQNTISFAGNTETNTYQCFNIYIGCKLQLLLCKLNTSLF